MSVRGGPFLVNIKRSLLYGHPDFKIIVNREAYPLENISKFPHFSLREFESVEVISINRTLISTNLVLNGSSIIFPASSSISRSLTISCPAFLFSLLFLLRLGAILDY